MAERARAIPLAALLCIVVLLVALRVRERGRSAREASSARDGARWGGRATAVTSGALDAGARPIARSTPADEHDGGTSAPHMLHGDARHTNRANAVGPSRANVTWTSRIGAPIEAQIVASLDERTLYVAALDGSLTALDAKDGVKVWSVALGDRVYSTPCVGSNGTIYVGSDARRFYAVTPQGAIAWKLETSGEADTGAVEVGDTIVFAAGSSVYAVRSGGDVAWRFDAKKKVFTAPAVGEGSMVAFGSQDHHVYALSSAGALRWSTDLGADVDGAPAIADDGAILVGTDGGEIVRLSPGGEVVWRTQVGGFVRGTLSIARNGDVLAGVYGPTPRLVRISPDGAIAGSFGIQGTGAHELGVHGGPLEDARGALFFGAQDDEVHGLGPAGQADMWEWSYRTGGDVDAPATLLSPTLVSKGGLVIGGDDGVVYFFGP